MKFQKHTLYNGINIYVDVETNIGLEPRIDGMTLNSVKVSTPPTNAFLQLKNVETVDIASTVARFEQDARAFVDGKFGEVLESTMLNLGFTVVPEPTEV